MSETYSDAINLFNNGNYDEAFLLFEKLGCSYECGYCRFASGQIERARLIWCNSVENTPAIEWGLSIIDLINLTIPRKLTFFQIRNFLERDLDILLKNKQLRFVENIISATDILSEYNPEIYKFVGRVLLNNGFSSLAFEFLEKARDICYQDPEVHYLLAQYYLAEKNYGAALKVIRKSLQLNPEYFPSTKIFEQIQQKLGKEL